MTSPLPFRIGLTDDGVYDMVMAVPSARKALENKADIEIARFPVDIDPIPADVLNCFDAVLTGGVNFTPTSTAGVDRCALIVRFGAGYDRVDLAACTESGIIVATTPAGVRRPMATAALTHILVLSTRFVFKSECANNGRWDEAQSAAQEGLGLTGRTIGFLGFGSIGKDLYSLIKPFDMRHLVFDPYLDEVTSRRNDIEQVDLGTLLSASDIVVILCALTEETHHLIGARELEQMKPSAYLVNVARGAIIDQIALAGALAEKQIQGAGLDALDPEPISPDDPLLTLNNVHLTPHALGITDELVWGCSELCVQAALDVMQGNRPESVINRDVLDHLGLRGKLDRYRNRYGG